jgi:hypothetical protein
MSTNAFPPGSRYNGIETAETQAPDGRTIVHLRRRFLPDPGSFALLQEHSTVEGDRIDNLAAAYLGDPELFWRLCDANGALFPTELTDRPGRVLRITLPEGLPASTPIA